MNDTTRNVIDAASVGTFLGYAVSALPVIALIFTVVWAIFRVTEMRTTHVIMFRAFGWRLDKWLLLPEKEQEKVEEKALTKETNKDG